METQITTMKNAYFSLAFLLFGSFALANNKDYKPRNNSEILKEKVCTKISKTTSDKKNSCTVTVKTATRNVTITVTCECSTGAACEQAYEIASFGLN